MRICPTCSTTYPTQVGFCPKDGSPLAELQEWAPGATIRGKYRILNTVGQGGMGSVYKALHLGFHELRALKVLNQQLAADARFVKRFKQEAFTTRKLQHPNIVRVEDIDETEEGRPFIVMEFIEGRSLHKLIEKHGALRVAAACSIMKQIASALLVAHGLGVVHRDLKPDNIVLLAPGKGPGAEAEPQVKVLDFGIAQLKEARAEGNARPSTLTQPGFILGTPEYMSPEQAKGKRGDDLDGRSDIYSLGIVMYQMLTGALPFQATTTMEMLVAQLHEAPRPIRSIRPDLQIPEPIADLVMQCLEKSREARPQTAQDIIQALERAESVAMNAAFAQEIPPAQAPSSGAAAPDRDRDAAQLREREAALREHEAALAREREAALARQHEAVLAREREAREHEAVLLREQEATLMRQREAALAQEREAVVAREHEAALAQEREVQEHEAALAREREAAMAREREAARAAGHELVSPAATVMVPRTDMNEALSAAPAMAKQERPPSPASSVRDADPLAASAKYPRRGSQGVVWAIVLAAIVLLGTIGLLRSNRRPAVNQPQPSSPPAIQSTTPSTDEKPVTPQSSDVSETGKTPEHAKPQKTEQPKPTTAELEKKISAAEKEGYLDQTHGNYDEAIRVYQGALKMDPTNATLREKIVQAERAKEREQEVLKH